MDHLTLPGPGTDEPVGILVTIPVHNEQELLRNSLSRLKAALDESGLPYRLAIVEDGSTDRTPEILEELRSEFPSVVITAQAEKSGRGLALRRFWSTVDAEVYLFVDADLAAGPPAVLQVLRAVQAGHDVVTGSRYVPGASVNRPPLRTFASLGYNWLVRWLFRETIRDHQCGLKGFSRRALRVLLPLTNENSWVWDTEILVVASRVGFPITEVPIHWTEPRGLRTPVRRLARDLLLHGKTVIRMKGELPSRLAGPVRSAFDASGGARDGIDQHGGKPAILSR